MEFITKIHLLEKKEHKNYQCIYSSQMYGTFFSIFALVDASYNTGDSFYTLKSIDLKIINYKGVVNMGIIGAELVDTGFDGGDPSKVVKRSLKIGVKPLVDNTVDFPVNLKSENLRCYIGTEILVERFLDPMHTKGSSYANEENGTFDDELFYREGLHNAPIPRTGYQGAKYEIRLWQDRDLLSKPVRGIGGWICPYMLLFVI